MTAEERRLEITERLSKLVRDLVQEYGNDWICEGTTVVVAPLWYEEEANILGVLLDDAQVVTLVTGVCVKLGNIYNNKLCRAFEDDYPSFMDLEVTE